MEQKIQQKNKDLVLEAIDTLFNKRDYTRAETFWSPKYIQHSAHVEPGREGLFNLVKSLPATLKYEPGLILADGDFVIVHGRISGFCLPVNWIAADILRIENGKLVEHWDVIQDEVTEEQSKSKAPMFGSSFPLYSEPEKKRVLIIGLDPAKVDYSDPALRPGMTAEKIHAGVKLTLADFAGRGWHADNCFINPDETAVPRVERCLAGDVYDCVVIAAGVRLLPNFLVLFEAVVNAIHSAAPQAAIAFNTGPEDSVAAAARWI